MLSSEFQAPLLISGLLSLSSNIFVTWSFQSRVQICSPKYRTLHWNCCLISSFFFLFFFSFLHCCTRLIINVDIVAGVWFWREILHCASVASRTHTEVGRGIPSSSILMRWTYVHPNMYGEDDHVVRLCSLMQQLQSSVECDVQWCDSADSTQRHPDGFAERIRQVTS